MESLSIGPLAIPLDRLFVLMGVIAVFVTAWLLERYRGVDAGVPIWWGLIAGILVGRGAHALAYWEWYRESPWVLLYFWQEGYMASWGVAAALLVAGLVALRRGIAIWVPTGSLSAGLLCWAVLAGGHAWFSPGPEGELPDVAFHDLEGEPVQIADLESKPVVINLWASWCPPCRREMPAFEQAQRHFSGEVVFLFANQGEEPGEIREYLAEEGLQLEGVLRDPDSSLSTGFGTYVMPTTLFFDAEGELHDMHVGEVSAPRLAEYVEDLRP